MIQMTFNPIKITQLSKDFNLKSKDVTDTFKDLGIDKKSGGSVNEEEFELFLDYMTKSHQIKSLDAYRRGLVKLTAVKEEKKAKKVLTTIGVLALVFMFLVFILFSSF